MSISVCRSVFFVIACLAASSVRAAVGFEKDLLPVLTKKCIDCHKAPYEENGKKKEPKAGLRLDASWAIIKGSENGPVLTPGAPDKSGLYEVVMLPKDDDGHMPPKGDDLTPEEIKLLKTWIEEGANLPGIDIAKKMADSKRARPKTPMNWTNKAGKALKATYEGMEGEFVLLRTEDGKIYKYPLANLNPAGQIQAKMQAE